MKDWRDLEPVERPEPPAEWVLYERCCAILALAVVAVLVMAGAR